MKCRGHILATKTVNAFWQRMRQIRLLLRDQKLLENLQSPGRLSRVECALQAILAILSYIDLERQRTETTHQQ